ncbi:glycosyltransferase family 2 protein [Cetobacterium sp.]|uniref:glycosyltransferase family 2 protein n=1 Tax=Cetobacterium sp. TaxID=2071632 RepID=UPI003F34261F
MKLNPKVEILMATYNGENYIEEQIESLFNQTYQNWNLVIRDDGSKDKTLEIIQKYENEYPNKIKLLKDNKGGLRAKDNFFELLRNSKENYVMFCDQDDIWLPNKIEITLDKMLEIENGPTLIHTDLKVVDKTLNIISNSFWKFQNIDPNRKSHNYLIVQNNITGCTVMINRELADLSVGDFPNGIMHDWIIGIIASLKGRIEYLTEPTILYRQHGKNDVGAQEYYSSMLKKIKKSKEIKKNMYKVNNQLDNILKVLYIENEDLKKELRQFIKLSQSNVYYRKYWILKNNYLKIGLGRKIAQIIMY